MNRQWFDPKQQALCLKYGPNSNYKNAKKNENESPLSDNSALILAQRIYKEFKLRKTSFKTTTVDKRYQMYATTKPSKAALNLTNSSFTRQNNSRIKPRTAVSRPQRIAKQFLDTPKLITASSWCVVDGKTCEFICGYNYTQSRQIASITKIMTCWLTLQLVEDEKLDLDTTIFSVPQKAEYIGGTTAQLQQGDRISIRDLLYGLMLPSGNDAAITLAHNFENLCLNFIEKMNDCAYKIGLEQTQFANSHGLFHQDNYSTAKDIAKLSYHALQNTYFASIVRTKIYFSEIEDRFGDNKEVFWENTNKMLYNGFKGVKTGITKEAGPCVVELYEDEERSYIIVLLNCRSVEQRWQDVGKILQWLKQL